MNKDLDYIYKHVLRSTRYLEDMTCTGRVPEKDRKRYQTILAHLRKTLKYIRETEAHGDD